MEFFSITDWIRPMVILVCGMLLFNLPTLLYKTRLTLRSFLYLFVSKDKKWKKTPDPLLVFGPVLKDRRIKVETKMVYLVRHGESTWNDTFNKGKHRSLLVFVLGYIPGLVKAFAYETYLVLSGKMDSWFYDAPLSHLGLSQVDELATFLEKAPSKDKEGELLSILRADPGAPPSKILCSNLRRAISTMAGGFRDRLSRRPEDKIMVITALQEISRNPDALSITPAHKQVTASWIERGSKICDFQGIFKNQFDMSLHGGNKPVDSNGLKRMNDFCEFIFSRSVKEDHVIVGGHSIWFRSFFRTFLPLAINHKGKTGKIVNCGVVAVKVLKMTTAEGNKYMLDPDSVRVLFGGFN